MLLNLKNFTKFAGYLDEVSDEDKTNWGKQTMDIATGVGKSHLSKSHSNIYNTGQAVRNIASKNPKLQEYLLKKQGYKGTWDAYNKELDTNTQNQWVSNLKGNRELQTQLKKSYMDKARQAQAAGRHNEAQYWSSVAKGLNQVNYNDFTLDNFKKSLEDRGQQSYNTRAGAIYNTKEVEDYIAAEGAKQISQEDIAKGFKGRVRNKIKNWWNNTNTPYISPEEEKKKQEISQNLRKDLNTKISQALDNEYMKSLGFVDEQGNPLLFNQLTPEQQNQYLMGQQDYADKNIQRIAQSFAQGQNYQPLQWWQWYEKAKQNQVRAGFNKAKQQAGY